MKKVPAILLILLVIACKKEPHHPPAPARGSLETQYGQCLPNTVHGTWYNGLSAEIDTNYVEINVHVTSPGSYTITSDKVNGVTFSASGIFSDTGMKAVRLEAAGAFIQPVGTEFHTSFDSTNCRFYVYPQDSSGLSIAENTWQFTVRDHTYRGTCTIGVYDIPQASGYAAQFTGKMASGSPDTVLDMQFYTNDDYLDTITYPTSHFGNSFTFYRLLENGYGKNIFFADNTVQPAIVEIHLNSVTVDYGPGYYKNVLIGTFNGSVRDSAMKVIPITNARFKVTY